MPIQKILNLLLCSWPLQVSLSNLPAQLLVTVCVDTITYYCSIVGVLQAGFAVFPVSFRNNEEAVTNLLARTGAKYVFTSNEPHILSLVNTAINADEPVQSYIMPKYEDLFPFHSDADLPSYRRRICTLDDSAIIFHSSGKLFIRSEHLKFIDMTCGRIYWAS